MSLRPPPPWPCSTCGAAGVRNIGTKGYCAAHLADFYRKLPTHVWDGVGLGLPVGDVEPSGVADVACSLCAATWTGPTFENCPWCLRAVADMRAWQAELLLTPPDVDPDDRGYDGAMRAWADRLVVAVRAGLITEHAARRSWSREVGDVVA